MGQGLFKATTRCGNRQNHRGKLHVTIQKNIAAIEAFEMTVRRDTPNNSTSRVQSKERVKRKRKANSGGIEKSGVE